MLYVSFSYDSPVFCRIRFGSQGRYYSNWNVDRYPNETLRHRNFLNDAAKILDIKDQNGWYNVTAKMLRPHIGIGILKKYNNSPTKLLSSVYPEYPRFNMNLN